jgi:hypothetical protein
MEIPENTKQETIKRLTDRYLFRGFSKEKKRWFFGSLTAIMLPSERFSTTITYQDETQTYVQIEVDPDSVGMFAFKYKDIKFFEGDMFHVKSQWEDLDYGYIIWNNDRSSFYIKNGEKYYRPVDKVIDSISYLSHLVRFEISKNGNIYERTH